MINDALRLLRLYLGLSQQRTATAISVSQSMISEIESGSKPVSMDILEKYSSAFNIRMSQILFFAEELNENSPKTRGRLIVASRVLRLLEKLSPHEINDTP